MKGLFYPKLAWLGIKKNKRTYMPYVFTCIGMVMMFYIISFLEKSKTLYQMSGGSTLQQVLGFGVYVMGFFAVIFLFYTNSFLIRQRKKEFGLYNILGMGKWNLARMLVWESLMLYAMAMAGGLLLGVLLSKLAELCVVNILNGAIVYRFYIDPASVNATLALFAFIFVLILLNTLRQIHVSKPVELLRSENVGEKPPKANWVMALAGAVVLGAAYVIAVMIRNPIEAMLGFFVAVLMVIAATYILFISGSVAFCRLLQKRKRFYYKTNHFVAVSSMSYRMKRNGSGLASICILSTMVLVMMSATSCLYFGKEEGMRLRYPQDIILDTYSADGRYGEAVRTAVQETLSEFGCRPQKEVRYRFLDIVAMRDETCFSFGDQGLRYFDIGNAADVCQFFIIPIEDYNAVMGVQETLLPDEAILYMTKESYGRDTITLQGHETLRVKKEVEEFVPNGTDASQIIPSIFLFVPDFDRMVELYRSGEMKEISRAIVHDYYGVDVGCGGEEQIRMTQRIYEKLSSLQLADSSFPTVSVSSIEKERAGFYEMYGSLFFLGILLGIVFIFATVLIIYYKQISEGYEDQAKFEIMQKVGMTEREIKKSVNSQVLFVFLLPLFAAGLHTAFAFPLIRKILLLFNCVNLALLIWTTVGCFLLFGFFYIIVFRLTSHAYYEIVRR